MFIVWRNKDRWEHIKSYQKDIRKNISLKFGTDGEQFTVNIDEYARLTMNDTTADNTEKMLIKALYNYRDKAAAYVQSLNGGKE